MKIKTVGKWLSRRTLRTAETINKDSEKMRAELNQLSDRLMKADSQTLFQDIATNTAEFLRNRHLPDAVIVHWVADDITQWLRGWGDEHELIGGCASIDEYILMLGFKYDSLEHLAGRILHLCMLIETHRCNDPEIVYAFRLGELTQLWKMYEYNEKNQFGSGRAKGRKRQKDAANYRKGMIDWWAKEEFRNSRQALAKPAKATITRARESSVRDATKFYSDDALEKLLRSAQKAVLEELDRHA